MFAGSRSALTSVSSVAARTSLAGPAAARRMATAAAQATTVESHPSSESSYLASSNASSESPKSFLHLPGRSRPTTPLENDLSPQKASQYISSILSLPPSREMPPALALRILTHKSYRGAHSLGQGYAERTSDASHHGSAPNNSRLTFLGKRAFHSYLLMFIHQQAMLQSTAASVPGTEFQQLNLTNSEGQAVTLDEMITAIASEGNLGKAVGSRWALEQVMRWQSNLTGPNPKSRDPGAAKVYGEGVAAILGGTFAHFGSPAAHRLFHLHILPLLAPQFNDQKTSDAVHEVADKIKTEMGGAKCVVP